MQKLASYFVIFTLLLIATACQKSKEQVESQDILLPDFQKQLNVALESSDTLAVTELVKNNRYRIGSAVNKYLNA